MGVRRASSRWFAAGLALALLLSACSPSVPGAGQPSGPDAARPAAKKRVAMAIRGEPVTLNDAINSAGAGGVAGVAELSRLVSSGLASVNQSRVIGPGLGEAIPTIENGLWKVLPDGRMETTWRIRQNARWHDGTPLTSADLLFTAEVGQDRQVAVLRDRAYDFVESLEAPDPQTVTVHWRQPYILADILFSDPAIPLPRHLLERPFVEDRAAFITQPYWTEEFIGSGPFKLREFSRGSHLVLDAFPDYPLGRPRLDEIEVRFFLDPNVIIANLLSGTIEMTLGRGISLEQGVQARDQWGEGKMDLSYSSWIALYPQFINANPPAIADLRFRRGLMHATDRKQLIDTIAYGLVPIPHNYVNPTAPEYRDTDSAAVRYEFDLRRAGQLIEEVGYRRGPDGVYRDAANQPLVVEIRTTSGDDFRDKLMFAVADQWKQAGVGAETVVIPRQRAEDREYRANRPGFEMVRQPNDMGEGALRRFTGKEAALPENDYRAQNRTRYMSPDLDDAIERYLTTIPIPERLNYARRIVAHVSENLVIMGITYNVEAMLISNRLSNVDATLDTRNGYEWDLR